MCAAGQDARRGEHHSGRRHEPQRAGRGTDRARRVHPASGRSYHVKFAPPKVADKDDMMGKPLSKQFRLPGVAHGL
ncbi:hypothetical protein PF007_g29528 [Phytophthora fragariae]|uniref:Adenylate kinase active site lid domain-containing protein n=1 Tax=Phytophthora fragariae TaxID=53985 RepID=A0A6A3H3Q4_9STRA|nr:hypothetical protein PF003_g12996 [Phytophthora fragariae]KAE8963663.1 hypothetical protein PF011_g28951 [Phytophthora fragariae]KAE9063507.1 hypothetical protein PF007_g29528 [Phytophthora fragariae]KAE9268689.1 hypothetical protein PF001_g29549 [Phytophthora fragariae]